ncbi:MAG: UDP-glucose 6-dehydrogenase [Betaproteobacteria bacterium TMED82]|nr:MAG: UDP-glucose 6-dehydrogenase [Betaproteobacteria bacterium TMED82]|tara:strand:+ start:21316 stop:22644 length:1329 start_codon:yes stop_codon:yes gene_type:complete
MNITIIGTGYVGLVTGACLADVGNNVLCVDVNQKKIEGLNDGNIPIYEPGLEKLVKSNVRANRLRFTTNVEYSVDFASIQFIAVGTPSDEDGSADLEHVLSAARSIGRYMKNDLVVVDKSTVPVGTADKVKLVIREELKKRNLVMNVTVISNPEFLKEGAALEDFQRPDRIIIGVDCRNSRAIMQKLYAPFQRTRDKVIFMSVRSAEMTKYAANAMLATRISFMNELANLSEKLGADIESVRVGIGSDARIGYSFLYPGCGYGGSCFPKDVSALIKVGEQNGQKLEILNAVQTVNQKQKMVLINKIQRVFGNDLSGVTFAVWGLSFKPGTDDIREAPSLIVIDELLKKGSKIKAFDPVALKEAKKFFGQKIVYCENPYVALENCEALIILTEWKEFRSPDFDKILKLIKTPNIFDGRNLYNPEHMESIGVSYHAIGRYSQKA